MTWYALWSGLGGKLAAVLIAVCVAASSGVTVGSVATPEGAPAARPAANQPLLATTSLQAQFPSTITVAGTIAWEGTGTVGLDLLYTVPGTETSTLALSPMTPLEAPFQTRIESSINMQQHYLPVGIELSFWWRIVDEQGITVAESAMETMLWQDDSRSWQTLESEQIILHHYALTNSFATSMLEIVQSTVDGLEHDYQMQMPDPIRIWIYESTSDFQAVRPTNTRESVAALAFPGFGVIAAIVPNGNDAELMRVLPHEISHQVLYQATANPFSNTPVWFDEGLATHTQTGGTSGYLELVIRAHERGDLFQLQSLTANFPYNAAQATLAYATSWSAITFIEATWGREGVARLIDAFAAGLPYDNAIAEALGISASELNDDWTAWVAAQAA